MFGRKNIRGGGVGYPRLYASVVGHEDVILASGTESIAEIEEKIRTIPDSDWINARSQWHYGIDKITVRKSAITATWIVTR